jgi:hypothetical protein
MNTQKYDLTHTAMVGSDGIPVFLIPSATPDREINDRRKRERGDILRIVNAHAELVEAAKDAAKAIQDDNASDEKFRYVLNHETYHRLIKAIAKAEGVTR